MRDQNPPPDPRRLPTAVSCPQCGEAITGAHDRCPRCALRLRGPVAAELWQLDGELAGLRAREAHLLLRRDQLLGLLREEPARRAEGDPSVRRATAGTGSGTEPAAPGRPAPQAPTAPRRDFSPKAVQNLLLVLGGLLLVVAAIVFTVVSWGHLGIGGRAAILAGVTALTLAAPRLLVKRELVATAETIAMFGVALLFLDGYAARRVGLAGADALHGLDYAALLIGLVAFLMAGYSRLLPLRLPLPVAIVLAQLPLPLLALDEAASWITAAFAVTAAADAAFLVFGGAGRALAVRRTAGVCFGVMWSLGVGYGALSSYPGATGLFGADDLPASLVKGVLLIVLAVVGATVASRAEGTRLRLLAAASAFALTAGLAAPEWPVLPSGWRTVPYTVAALATAVLALRLPGPNASRARSAGAVSAAILAALTAVPFLPVAILVLLLPFGRLDDVWSGIHGFDDGRWVVSPFPEGAVVFGLLTLAAAVTALRGRRPAWGVALAAGAFTVAVAPMALGWGHVVDVGVLTALAVALVAGLTLTRQSWRARAFTAAAGPVTAVAVATALADRGSTYAVLAVLLVAYGLAAFTARVSWAAAVALAAGVLSATGLIWAVATGTGWQRAGEGLSLALAVGALLAGLLTLRWPAARVAASAPDGGADPRRETGLVLGAVLAALAPLPVLGAIAEVLRFYRPVARPWTALDSSPGRHPLLIVITILVAVAAVLLSWQAAGRKGALRAGLTAWPMALVALPVSVGLPYGLEVGLFVAGLGPLAWTAARSRTNWAFGAVAALCTASVALSWALAVEPATLVVFPVVAVTAATTAFYGRVRAVRVAGAGLATLLAGGEALAAGLALEWPVRHAAFGMLAVACLAAAVAGRFRRSTFAIGVETAGYGLAAAGLTLGAADLPLAGLACAVVGVLMAGTALRPDRRWAGYVSTSLLLMASWLRLLASDITVVEAYTVPFSLVLLVFGWWRARGREISSWVSYGSGLASSLLPSVIAMLAGTGWIRPLLLGVASLAVLLIGARFRLQAPALLGGLTLAAVALHELAPWIAQVVVMVPRWVPMAAGGLLLVVVGATYEARLGDVRRLRAAVGRMR